MKALQCCQRDGAASASVLHKRACCRHSVGGPCPSLQVVVRPLRAPSAACASRGGAGGAQFGDFLQAAMAPAKYAALLPPLQSLVLEYGLDPVPFLRPCPSGPALPPLIFLPPRVASPEAGSVGPARPAHPVADEVCVYRTCSQTASPAI